MNNSQKIAQLLAKKNNAKLGGGQTAIDKQHKRGKLTARERIDLLLDEDTFEEFDMFVEHNCDNFGIEKKKAAGDGVVTGYGTINNKVVYVFAQDFTFIGGTLSKTYAEKICKLMDRAMKVGAPIIGLNDSGGARIQEGVDALAGYAEIFWRNVQASGVVPQLTAILGPCAGGAVYSPAITDFVVMNKSNSFMFVTGPKVVKSVLNEDISTNDLGGPDVHTRKSGVANFESENEEEAISILKEIISYVPSNNMEEAPCIPNGDPTDRRVEELNSIIPDNPNKPYDVTEVIRLIMDEGKFLEVGRNFAQNVVVGFARLNGHSVGIVANQPKYLAGCLDIDSSVKASRFIRYCDSFNIPLVVLEDVPGFLPGSRQEHNGIIRHGAKLLYAFAEATVPKITVILRKAYGGAYCVMNSIHMRADSVFAWPSAEIAVMGPQGAVNVIHRREAKKQDNPEEFLQKKKEEYEDKFANPYNSARKGYVDDVIEPASTRIRLIRSLETLATKREETPAKKHGNIPL